MSTAAIVFEGGRPPRNPMQETILQLRQAVTLDTLEKLLSLPGLDRVVLATNREVLAEEARRLGAAVMSTGESFRFARELPRAIRYAGAEAVIYLSGVAVPLMSPGEWGWVLRTLAEQAPCVVVNNPQSADLVAWSPAAAVERIDLQRHDNFLGYLLRHDAGLERHLIPNSAAVHFDLDTPTDYLVLAESGRAGNRAREALAALDWDPEPVRRLGALMRQDLAEVGLVGRVGTAVVEFINMYLRLRLRIFSEERGMKALGREEQGLVVSFMAGLMGEIGPAGLFRHLAAVCQGLAFDSRVVLAHGGRRVSEWDRYHSDLGRVDAIQDPWVREFTAAALAAGIPVVLGGHSVVAGGLWLMAEQAVAVRGGPQVRYR